MFIEFIEQSDLAKMLSSSLWLYPIVNTGHILGLSLVIGSIIPFDLKLLGCWQSLSLTVFNKVLRPVAISGFFIAVIFGLLLFITRADFYLGSSIFNIKITLIMFAFINSFFLHTSKEFKLACTNNIFTKKIKFHAAFSIILWLSIAFLGRLVGYR